MDNTEITRLRSKNRKLNRTIKLIKKYLNDYVGEFSITRKDILHIIKTGKEV